MRNWLLGFLVLVVFVIFGLSQGWGAVVIPQALANAPGEVRTIFLTGVSLICLVRFVRKLIDIGDTFHRWILRFQHCFNPLHVYCRLAGCHLNRRLVLFFCAVYERLFYAWMNWLSVKLDTGLAGPLKD